MKRTKDPEKKKDLKAAFKIWSAHLEKLKKITKQKAEQEYNGRHTDNFILYCYTYFNMGQIQ